MLRYQSQRLNLSFNSWVLSKTGKRNYVILYLRHVVSSSMSRQQQQKQCQQQQMQTLQHQLHHVYWQQQSFFQAMFASVSNNRSRPAAYTYHVKQATVRGFPGQNNLLPSAVAKRYYRSERPYTAEERRQSRIEKMLKNRWYEYSEDGNTFYRSKDAEWMDFSLVTYNLLAQNLLEDNIHLYRHCAPEYLDWQYRCRNLIKELTCLNADVFCLQEIMEEHYKNFFEPKLHKCGYDGVFKKKTDLHALDGCAIFFKRSKFFCVSVCPVEYFDHKVPVLDRHNVGLVVRLRNRHQSKRAVGARHRSSSVDAGKYADVCIATTHLLFNPKRGDVKLAQLMKLFTTINEVARKPTTDEYGEYCPVILCGDMNSSPFSDLYRFIRTGYLSCDDSVVPYMCARPEVGKGSDWNTHGRVLPRTFLSPNAGISDNCERILKKQRGKNRKSGDLRQDQAASEKSNNELENHTIGSGKTVDSLNSTNAKRNKSQPGADDEVMIVCDNDGDDIVKDGSSSSKTESAEVLRSSKPVTQGSGVIRHPFSLLSVYAHDGSSKTFDRCDVSLAIQPHCNTSEATSCHCATNDTVDYIFYTPYNTRIVCEMLGGDPLTSVPENTVSMTSLSDCSTVDHSRGKQKDTASGTDSKSTTNSGGSEEDDVIFIDDSYSTSNECGTANEVKAGSRNNVACVVTKAPEQLRLLARLRLPTVRDMNFVGGLPNQFVSSDHVPLLAVFAVRLNDQNKNL